MMANISRTSSAISTEIEYGNLQTPRNGVLLKELFLTLVRQVTHTRHVTAHQSLHEERFKGGTPSLVTEEEILF